MKLFVAKLNREANEANLTEQFSQFGGVVSVKVVTVRDTGQSKCFGFIEMDSDESGNSAIANQNGEEFLGFRMVVKQAEDKPKSPRPPSSSAPRRDSSSGAAPQRNAAADKKSFPSKSTKKKVIKKRPGSSDKFADGPRKTTFEKRPKSNRNQWLDDLDDF
jgi:RNA recognition motif-containing protein